MNTSRTSPVSTTAPLLSLAGISKRFPGVVANQQITLDVQAGEIHAIVGENGAGKTTLMNILYGLYRQDEGTIRFNDRQVDFHSPGDAIACGIGMVHQHFMLIPTLSVTENVILGEQGFILDIRTARQRILELSKQFGLAVDPDASICDLPVGARQRVEIIKALYREAKLLILDEPTSVLTPQETRDFFHILKTLVRQGLSVIFITHKLQEVLEVSDRATVLRKGQVVKTVKTADVTQRELAQMMVGRAVLERLDKVALPPGDEVLRVEHLTLRSTEQASLVQDVSFAFYAGEIFGIAGVSGNGQSELAEILAGLRSPSQGRIFLNGREVRQLAPRRLMQAGLAHIPEERQKMAVVMDFPLYENSILGSIFDAPFSHHALLNSTHCERHTNSLLVSYDISTRDISTRIHDLSGGNQQKFVVGRELARAPKILLAVQPTRGVDIGSTEYIHQKLLEQRAQGVAILLISTELDEILALSDRIAVMYQGRMVDILAADQADREAIGLMMAGGK